MRTNKSFLMRQTSGNPQAPHDEAEADRIREAVANGQVSHSRYGSGLHRDVIWVYARDRESPSGFILFTATKEQYLCRAGLVGPLAPQAPIE